MRSGWSWLVGVFAGAFLLAPLCADEATTKDGRRISGALRLDKTGRLLFAPKKGASLPLADLASVRLATAPAPPFRIGAARRVRLTDGQQLTGAFLGLEKQAIVLRTAWADRARIPRSALAALTPLPGWLPVLEDDVRAPVAKGAGQARAFVLPAQLPAGRIGVNFEPTGATGGARWQLEAHFTGKPARVLRITVAGPGGDYEVDSAGLGGSAPRVARSPGPHRLVVQFSARSLRITCDEEALWFNLEKGPGGALRQVSLKGGPGKGAVVWSELTVERAVAELPRPAGDPTQDELWLASGDQLFGKVVRADHKAIALEGKFGTRSFPWSDLRGWFPRREAPRPGPMAGTVRLEVCHGLDAADDVLDGAVTALNDRQLTLRHALFGEVRLDRRCVTTIRPR